ncbi:alkaline phytoceramidase [Colletotrichum orchidophilum]|uniref:Alkaline phytoceramidase n=1 Tax=Colletotrichum orchidophilum TaxID=1209926 RepID=A0A1G4ARI8_9PEZI|nr:alkaline phytoceramidase [Colletotrichum orchidophilum]OHE91770.1 alkaline phytoceramidase [Colletotrichum orchidophilum]
MASSPLFQALRVAYNDDTPDGYWGEKTSTLNFCEEDYVVSYYCAEVCNVTEITDLLDPMQLIDELSMIYTTCLMVFATFSFSKSGKFSVILGSGLILLAGFITVRSFHHNAFTRHRDQVVLRSLYVMETQLRPVLTERNNDKTNNILNTMWIMVGTGLGVFLMGFLIWNIDNAFCSQMRQWRRQLGLPWGALLEGHAWWHLMTGVGGMEQRTDELLIPEVS